MYLRDLVAKLQTYCNQGFALDEVEIHNEDGLISIPDTVKLTRDFEKESIRIEVHKLNSESL